MDVELGLELAKCLDDFVSTSPIFISGETDIMFILTAVLKGYTRELIKIDVNECLRSMVISGEKPVQDVVTVAWKVHKKEIKMIGFTKAFIIPDGVIIDHIKARFNKENCKLTVAMPKMVKGVKGITVKEVKVEEFGTGDYRSLQVDDDDGNIRKIDLASGELTTIQTFAGKIAPDVLPWLDSEKMGKALEETSENHNSVQEHEALKSDQNEERVGYDGEGSDSHSTQGKVFNDEPSTTTEKKFRDQSTQTDPPRKPKKCCVPMLLVDQLYYSLYWCLQSS